MDLQTYTTAASIKEQTSTSVVYARVIKGRRQGTVGRIIDVRSPYYSQHFYRLSVTGKRPFWVKDEVLELLTDWQGETQYCFDRDSVPTHKDMMGRDITLGSVLVFPRLITSGSVEMIMGTVRRISDSGTIYVAPFRNSDRDSPEKEVSVGKPHRSTIIDKDTINQIMLTKMSVFR